MRVWKSAMVTFSQLQHVSVHPKGQQEVADLAFRVAQHWLLRVEEQPVVTRFGLDAACVQTLLCWHLLGLPVNTMLIPGAVKPREITQKRV